MQPQQHPPFHDAALDAQNTPATAAAAAAADDDDPAYGQDPATGLPQHRREQLLQVFRTIDKDGVGISLRSLQTYANKYGGETLTLDDLRGLFADFKPAVEHFVSQGCALLC